MEKDKYSSFSLNDFEFVEQNILKYYHSES